MGLSAAAVAGVLAIAETSMTAIVIAGAINGAIVGAVVGGLTAAVTGGSIGQGILVGAVGGMVGGGLASAFTGTAFGAGAAEVAGSGSAGGAGGASGSLGGAWSNTANLLGGIGSGGETAVNTGISIGSGAGSGGGSMLSKGLVDAGTQVVAKGLETGLPLLLSPEDQEDWTKTEEGQRAALDAQLEATRIQASRGFAPNYQREVAGMNIKARKEELATQRQQFKEDRANVSDTLRGLKVASKGELLSDDNTTTPLNK